MPSSKKRSITDFFRPADKAAPSTVLRTPQRTPSTARDGAATRQPEELPLRQSPIRRFPAPRDENKRYGSSEDVPPTSRIPALAPAQFTEGLRQTPRTSSAPNMPPNASQTSTTSGGSKKTTINGEQVVLNSDSDSDDLEEIDFGVRPPSPRKAMSNSVRSPEKPRNAPATRSGLLGRSDDLRRPSNKYRLAKPTLKTLVQATQKDAEKEQTIEASKAELDRAAEEASLEAQGLSKEALADVVEENEDGDMAERLYLAMQRTQALDVECNFHFFRENLVILNSHKAQEAAFPTSSLPQHGWVGSFADAQRRDQAFASGFAQQVFQFQQLPEELAAWMVDQLYANSDESLNSRYLELLKSHPPKLSAVLTVEKLNDIFSKIGADVSCTAPDQQIVPSFDPLLSPKRSLPSSLRWIIRLLGISAKSMPAKTNAHLLRILFHLCFDDSVMADALIFQSVQEAIEVVIGILPSEELAAFSNYLITHIEHPVLQSHLLRSLPARTSLLAAYRQRLALAFLLHPKPLPASIPDPALSALMHNHLDTSPDFFIDQETDYACLAARFATLDIAIGPGLTTIPPPRPPKPSSPKEEPAGLPRPMILTKEEIAFNQHIDTLAQHVKYIISKISEVGAISDPNRLQAKDNGEKLVHRLQSAARIGGRKRNNVFGIGKEEHATEGQRTLFKNWRKGKSGAATPASGVGVGTPPVADLKGGVKDGGAVVNGVTNGETIDVDSMLQDECRKSVSSDTENAIAAERDQL